MSWASLGNNQTVSYNNLQDAVNNGVFTLKNTIPVSSKQTTKGEAEFFVNIDPILKATEQLVVKSNLVANNSTTTTTTTVPSSPTRYALAGTTGNLYISNNAGFDWGTVSFFNGMTVELVKVSSSGQYMLANAYPIGGSTRTLYLSSDYGNSWLPTINNTGVINDIDVSDDGQYIVFVKGSTGGNVYRSTNSGTNWSTSGTPGVSNWKSVTMSSTGQYVTLVSLNSWIWVSSNYGASYTSKTAYPSTNWGAVCMSSDGQYQVAGRDTIYRSTDFGSTWTNVGAPVSNGYGALAMSGDGQYLLGLSYFRNLELYRSTNYGANWSTVTLIGSGGNGNWRCVSISPDNGVQLVGANGNVWPTNEIWRSGNGGILFTAVSGTNIGWDSISVGNQL
jgi:hypothetical protein